MTTNHRTATTAVLGLLLAAAAAAPGASARPTDPDAANPPSAAVYSPQDKSIVAVTSPSTRAVRTASVNAPQAVVRAQAPDNGFDWGDAGIGAAGGLALSIIGVGGALAVSQHRNRDTTA
jgi:hypothetical protein